MLLQLATTALALHAPLYGAPRPHQRTARLSAVDLTVLEKQASPAPATAEAIQSLSDEDKLAAGLSFAAGVTDVVTFRQFGCFGNMMTGNSVQLASALGLQRWLDVCFSGSLLLAYCAGIGLYRVIDVKKRGRRFTTSIFAPAVFALFVLTDVVLGVGRGTRWALPLLAGGCGIVNAASSEVTGSITTMMTGHLQKLSNFAADSIALGQSLSAAQRAAAATSIRVVACFLVGIVTATGAIAVLGALRPTAAACALRPVGLPVFAAMGSLYAAMLVAYDRGAWLDVACACGFRRRTHAAAAAGEAAAAAAAAAGTRGGAGGAGGEGLGGEEVDDGQEEVDDSCTLDLYETQCEKDPK